MLSSDQLNFGQQTKKTSSISFHSIVPNKETTKDGPTWMLTPLLLTIHIHIPARFRCESTGRHERPVSVVAWKSISFLIYFTFTSVSSNAIVSKSFSISKSKVSTLPDKFQLETDAQNLTSTDVLAFRNMKNHFSLSFARNWRYNELKGMKMGLLPDNRFVELYSQPTNFIIGARFTSMKLFNWADCRRPTICNRLLLSLSMKFEICFVTLLSNSTSSYQDPF